MFYRLVPLQKHFRSGGPSLSPVYFCSKQYSDDNTLIIGHELYMLFLLFFLPVIVMIIAYGGVCIELWAVTEDIAPERCPIPTLLVELRLDVM